MTFFRSGQQNDKRALSGPSARLVVASFMFFLGCMACAMEGRAQDTLYQRFYFDESTDLKLDTKRVAIFANSLPMDAIQDATNWQVGVHDVIATGVPGSYFLALPKEMRGAQTVESLIKKLGSASGIRAATPVFFDDFGGPLYFEPEVLVAFKDGALTSAQQRAAVASMTGSFDLVSNWSGMANTWKFEVNGGSGFEALRVANVLAARQDVLYAEPVMYFSCRSNETPNDQHFPTQWGLHNTGQSGGQSGFDMDVPEAWDITKGDPSIKVVVFETGVQLDHPDLNMAGGSDFTNNPAAIAGNPNNSCDNHGTAVAGCISAKNDNLIGVSGVAPNCPTASARIGIAFVPCNGSFTSQTTWSVNAINWAQSSGARVTNNSNSYGSTSSAISTAYTNTRNAGLVHFASSGNTGTSGVAYPASLSTVNAIGATDRFGALATFSTTGSQLAFSAPGVDIVTTDRTGNDGYVLNNNYVFINGTSFSSPYSAAVAALILSVDASLTPAEVEMIMQESATDLGAAGWDSSFGHGMVNAHKAVIIADKSRKLIFGETTGDQLGRAVSGLGDINGDGIPDFIAGIPKRDSNGPDAGSANIYSGADCSILFTVDGDNAGDEFGRAVCGVGDVNGDGTPDFAVGGHLADNTGNKSGTVRVFSGVDASVLYTFNGEAAEDQFGRSVSGAGDANGDGFADIVVGARLHDSAGANSGRAYVFSGMNGSIIHTLDGESAGELSGGSVSGAGDVNDDGFDDVIVGSHLNDVAATNAGSARVFSGFDGSVIYTLRGDSANDQFGWSVSGAGDVDCDGYSDFVVGAPLDDDNGADSGSARVFSGFDGLELYTFLGSNAGDKRGFAVAAGGDVNGDGYDDIIAGSNLSDASGTNAGIARVFSGFDGAGLLLTKGVSPNSQMGIAVSSLGDVNLDGFDDILVGASSEALFAFNGGLVEVAHAPTLPLLSYDFKQPGLDLKLTWTPDGSDPFATDGTISVFNATPGGLGLAVVSLAPSFFPSGFGFPLLIATDPTNVVENGPFGFGFLGELVAPNISRQNPFLAGSFVFIQTFETSPFIRGSNALRMLMAP